MKALERACYEMSRDFATASRENKAGPLCCLTQRHVTFEAHSAWEDPFS